jgi:hypothetical protein
MQPRTALAYVIVARTGAPFHCAIVADIRGMEGWQRPGAWAGPDDLPSWPPNRPIGQLTPGS